jgi:hypothetical protein
LQIAREQISFVSFNPHPEGHETMTEKTKPEPMAFGIAEAVAATGGAVSRTRLFALIAQGQVDARRCGKRTVVLADSLRRYLESLPAARAAPSSRT